MISLTVCALCLMMLQMAFFAWIWNSSGPIHMHKADLIVVFPGEQDRIVEGHGLARAGNSDNLLIIGQTKNSITKQVKQFGDDSPSVKLVTSKQSRSTFEDVIVARQIILENHFKSVVLVTSSYHMPRVLFLFKTILMASGIKVELQYYPVELRDNSNTKRFCFNEIIKFWGSLVEMLGYQLTGDLLRDIPLWGKVGHFVKYRFLL